MVMNIKLQHKNHQLSILENAYVISRIRGFLSSNYEQGKLDGTIEEMHILTRIARSQGVLAFVSHVSENEIIQEFIELIVKSIQSVTGNIDFEDLEIPAFVIIPRIIYSNLTDIEFIKTVLLYESIIMTITGYDAEIIDYRLRSIVSK